MRKPRKAPAGGKGGGAVPKAGGKRGLGHARGGSPAAPRRGLKARHAQGAGGGSIGPVRKPAPKKTPVKRKWSPGSDVACCSAEALGTLLGWGWDDVLDLYWRTCQDPDEGATIADTLLVARVTGFEPASRSEITATLCSDGTAGLAGDYRTACTEGGVIPFAPHPGPLILGVTLPEPHAVAVTPDGTWWSWGEPFDPADWPGLIIDEAWAVEWR